MASTCSELEKPSERRSRIGKQILMFVAASFGYLAVGMTLTWPNVFASDLAVNNKTIFGTQIEFSEWQMDMVGSMLFLGSLPGFLLAGWLVRAFGRRWSLVAASIPGLVGALLIALAVSMEMVLVGRFLEGVMFGMMGVAARTYIVEIADTDIRGSASVVVNLMMQVGSLSVLSLGIPLAWYQLSFLSIGFLVCYCCIMVPLLPESPTFLIVTQRDKEAEAVLRRLRGPAVDVPKMLQNLRKQNEAVSTSAGWGFLLQKEILKREFTLFGLFLIANFTGVQVLKANTVRMLESSGLALGKKLSAVLVTAILFIGNFLMLLLLDRLGRRRCLLISLSLLAIAYLTLGTYSFLGEESKSAVSAPEEMEFMLLKSTNFSNEYYVEDIQPESNLSWIPLACLMVAALGQSLGSGPIPWILSPEYFPTTIRSQAMCVCTLMGSLQAFASLQLFTPMKSFLTDAGLYWTYSTSALIGIPYTLLFVKETKGVSVG